MVSEMKIFFFFFFFFFFLSFFFHKSIGANDPQGVASSDPTVLILRMYVGDTKHCYTLNILVFPIISLWELMVHGAWPV